MSSIFFDAAGAAPKISSNFKSNHQFILPESAKHTVFNDKFELFFRSKMPTVQRLKTSRTWTNEMLYGPTNIRKGMKKEVKEEL